MTADQAQRVVNYSALVVAGIYLYRRLVETPDPTPTASGGTGADSTPRQAAD